MSLPAIPPGARRVPSCPKLPETVRAGRAAVGTWRALANLGGEMTKAEQETIVRWDEEDKRLDIYTASPRVAERLRKRGYDMQPIRRTDGEATGWRCLAPENALTFRRIVDGIVPKPIYHPEGNAAAFHADRTIRGKNAKDEG